MPLGVAAVLSIRRFEDSMILKPSRIEGALVKPKSFIMRTKGAEDRRGGKAPNRSAKRSAGHYASI